MAIAFYMRELFDSMEIQKEQFATQSAAIALNDPKEPTNEGDLDKNAVKWQITVPEEDEAKKMLNQPKFYNLTIERTNEMTLEGRK